MVAYTKVGSVLRPKSNICSANMFHVELSITSIVVAVVKIGLAVVVATQIMVIVRFKFDHVVMQVLDGPDGSFVSIAFEVQFGVVSTMTCKRFVVNAQLYPLSISVE